MRALGQELGIAYLEHFQAVHPQVLVHLIYIFGVPETEIAGSEVRALPVTVKLFPDGIICARPTLPVQPRACQELNLTIRLGNPSFSDRGTLTTIVGCQWVCLEHREKQKQGQESLLLVWVGGNAVDVSKGSRLITWRVLVSEWCKAVAVPLQPLQYRHHIKQMPGRPAQH